MTQPPWGVVSEKFWKSNPVISNGQCLEIPPQLCKKWWGKLRVCRTYPLSGVCVILCCMEVIRCLEEGGLLSRETLSMVSKPPLLAGSKIIVDGKSLGGGWNHFLVWPHWGGCRLCIWLRQTASLSVTCAVLDCRQSWKWGEFTSDKNPPE